ncbi:unnamed protein product [Brachionus calyciflorus]|uniref:Uncharacterized protein n=1 Tax=Brachionus calyciflorus TaxID=104777 RepID=A0A813WC31_9BILA|nr:unnamed protein product [Brachionus calyciflorus]
MDSQNEVVIIEDDDDDKKALTKINLNIDELSHNVNLNENTQGFVTQVNSPEPADKERLSPVSDKSKNSHQFQSNQKALQNNEEKRKFSNKKKKSLDPSNEPKNLKLLNQKEYDFVIPALKSATNSFISAHQNLNNNNNLKDDSKKSFEFFPEINIENSKYNPKNVFDKNVYVSFLTKKVQSELRSKKNESYLKQNYFTMENKPLKSGKLTKLNNSFNYELSSNENFNEIEETDKSAKDDKPKHSGFIMPIRPSFKIKSKNKSRSNDFLIVDAPKRNKPKPKSSTALGDEKDLNKERVQSRFTENLRMTENKPGRKVIDLNVVSNQSVLSSHYLNKPVSRLSDLKLNEKWPSSTMYKFTIQTNPWVKSFKEKSYANEINSSLRELSSDDLKRNSLNYVLMHSKHENKNTQNFFPNIKQIFS